MNKIQSDRAREWFLKHCQHVNQIRIEDESVDGGVEPSKEDIGHPELWKAMHWRWYFTKIDKEN